MSTRSSLDLKMRHPPVFTMLMNLQDFTQT